MKGDGARGMTRRARALAPKPRAQVRPSESSHKCKQRDIGQEKDDEPRQAQERTQVQRAAEENAEDRLD